MVEKMMVEKVACRECPVPMFGPEVPFPPAQLVDGGIFDYSAGLGDSTIATEVRQVEIIRLNTPKTSYVIIALGIFTGINWKAPRLIRTINVIEPVDGIYEADLIADDGDASPDNEVSYKTAVMMWVEVPEDFRGLRVHGLSQYVEVMAP
jgi:hypothetical protein